MKMTQRQIDYCIDNMTQGAELGQDVCIASCVGHYNAILYLEAAEDNLKLAAESMLADLSEFGDNATDPQIEAGIALGVGRVSASNTLQSDIQAFRSKCRGRYEKELTSLLGKDIEVKAFRKLAAAAVKLSKGKPSTSLSSMVAAAGYGSDNETSEVIVMLKKLEAAKQKAEAAAEKARFKGLSKTAQKAEREAAEKAEAAAEKAEAIRAEALQGKIESAEAAAYLTGMERKVEFWRAELVRLKWNNSGLAEAEKAEAEAAAAELEAAEDIYSAELFRAAEAAELEAAELVEAEAAAEKAELAELAAELELKNAEAEAEASKINKAAAGKVEKAAAGK